MPEGDTIFRTARTLERALAGRTITRFESALARLTKADDDGPLAGRTVEHVEARGKWLLMFLSGDLVLLTHMLMNGSWHIYRPGEAWRRARRDMRIVVETAEWTAVAFAVPVAEFHTAESLARKEGVTTLGPDLLKTGFDTAEAARRLRGLAGMELGPALLNQRVMAGIGNVFKSEICFACGVNPFARVEWLTAQQVERILDVSLRYLRMNVREDREGFIGVNDGSRRTTGSLDAKVRLWVYGRRGEPCRRCGSPIQMRKQGADARNSFWCEECQPLTGRRAE